MKRSAENVFLWFFLCLSLPFIAYGAPQPAIHRKPATVDGTPQDVPLNSLQAHPGPIRLRGAASMASLTFPVSLRQQVSDMTLSLFVTNSISLVNRSQIVVSVNGSVVGQVAFRAAQPETRVRMRIPAELIAPGYNKLTFSVAQHYTDKCEDPTAPELWSEIDTLRSHLDYTVVPRALKPTLAELPLLMDKRLQGDYALTIATTAAPDDALVESGALVAQAAALSRDYAPVTIRSITVPTPQDNRLPRPLPFPAQPFGAGDGVLMGTRDQLATWLDKPTYARAAQPLLAIYPLGAGESHFLLVVTGADDQQVHQAAKALAVAYTTLPPSALANVRDIVATGAAGRPTLIPGMKLPLSALGYTTTTRQGIYPQSINVRFWVPADRYADPDGKFILHLHMAYGAGLGAQSTFDIFLNDHFQQSIHLTERLGGVFYDYKIPIPVTSIAPGWNELQFHPTLMPEREQGACQPIYTGNLLLTLFDDSYVESGSIQRLAQLPDLGLLSRTGYPYAGGQGANAVTLALAGRDNGNLAAAWSLLAKMATVNSKPILNVGMFKPDSAAGNVLAVGQFDAMPAVLRKGSALNRADWLSLGAERLQSVGGGLLDMLFGTTARAAEQPALQVTLGDVMARGVVVTQFESPLGNDNSVTMVLSDSPRVLADGVAQITTDRLWRQLAQGTSVLVNGSDQLFTYQAPHQFMVGDAGNRARLSLLFERAPLLAFGVVLAMILLFALFTLVLLKRYRRRHHHGQGV